MVKYTNTNKHTYYWQYNTHRHVTVRLAPERARETIAASARGVFVPAGPAWPLPTEEGRPTTTQ